MVLRGTMRVARDKRNPIRGNLVASALRELVGHTLDRLASESEVKRCVWFAKQPHTDKPTRSQRARYIVQAGLPAEFIGDTLHLDVDAAAKPLVKAMEALHKATHVRANTVVSKGSEVRRLIGDVLVALRDLMAAARTSRERTEQAVVSAMHDAVFENLMTDSFESLDVLSTHSRVDGHLIHSISIVRLDADEIRFSVEGEVEVELQYGSNSDVANDIGHRDDDSYPYKALIVVPAQAPTKITADNVTLSLDTRSFYE